jgi:WD40 repeat protein
LAQVFDSQTGTLIAELRGHQNGDVAAAFSPDGKSILTAGQDGTVRLWDTGVVQPTPSQPISFARDEALVVSGFAGPDPASPLTLTKVSPLNGNRPGGEIRDSTTGAPVVALAGDPDVVFRASFDARGSLVFTADESPNSNTVAGRVWNARTGALVRVLAGPGAAAIDGVLSDDGKLLATFDQSGVVTVWRTATGQPVRVFTRHKQSKPPYGLYVSLTFSHDGSLLLTGDSAGHAYLWRLRDGRVLNTYGGAPQPPRSDNGAAGGAISRDDTTVLFSDPWDQVGKLYRVGSANPIGLLRGTSTGIRSASFNADGSLLVTNGFDGDRVWDVASRQPLLVVTDPAAPFPATVRFGSDGHSIISAAPNEVATRASYRQTFACDVCGGIDALLALAQQRLSRGLTPSERKQFLHQ